jgi:aconitate hydratase
MELRDSLVRFIDLENEPLGKDKKGEPVFLRDIWPTSSEIAELISENVRPHLFK